MTDTPPPTDKTDAELVVDLHSIARSLRIRGEPNMADRADEAASRIQSLSRQLDDANERLGYLADPELRVMTKGHFEDANRVLAKAMADNVVLTADKEALSRQVADLQRERDEFASDNNDAHAENTALSRQVERLREALAPFAASASDWDAFPDDTSMLGALDTKITVGDLRRAKSALTAIRSALQSQGSGTPVAWRWWDYSDHNWHVSTKQSEADGKPRCHPLFAQASGTDTPIRATGEMVEALISSYYADGAASDAIFERAERALNAALAVPVSGNNEEGK